MELTGEEAPTEEAVVETETPAPETTEVEKNDPLEEWTRKELKEECRTLRLSDRGKKAQLIERIKEGVASVEEIVAIEETEVPVEKAQAVEEAPAEGAPVEVASEEGI